MPMRPPTPRVLEWFVVVESVLASILHTARFMACGLLVLPAVRPSLYRLMKPVATTSAYCRFFRSDGEPIISADASSGLAS